MGKRHRAIPLCRCPSMKSEARCATARMAMQELNSPQPCPEPLSQTTLANLLGNGASPCSSWLKELARDRTDRFGRSHAYNSRPQLWKQIQRLHHRFPIPEKSGWRIRSLLRIRLLNIWEKRNLSIFDDLNKRKTQITMEKERLQRTGDREDWQIVFPICFAIYHFDDGDLHL